MNIDGLYEEIVSVSGSVYHARIKTRIMNTWRKVAPLISRDSIVVDVGVGPISAMIRRIKGAKVIGLSLVDLHRELCDTYDIELKTCDIEHEPLPMEDESVDLILFMEVIEHLCIWPSYVLDGMYRKLKPGGYIVVSTMNFLRISNRIRMVMGKNPLINYFEATEDGRNHIREFVLDEMLYYMKKSGFGIVETCRLGIPSGPVGISVLLRMAYLYPRFRNYFMIIGRK